MDAISVIIINWNRRADVLRAVHSALAAARRGDEVIVWDNGSTDGSVEALRATFGDRPDFRLLQSAENLGVCKSRNAAACGAKGAILVFMDSDSELVDTTGFDRLRARFAGADRPAALNFEIRSPTGRVWWPFARRQGEWSHREFPITRIDGCGFAIARADFDAAGGFPEHFGYGAEEHYLARRLIALGREVRYFPSVAVIHHQVSSGRTADQFSTMMRNHVWMPLELFRMPWALGSAIGMAALYLRDAVQEKRLRDFFRGLWWTIRDFRCSRRRPMPPAAWRRFRAIIAEDRRLR